MNVFQSSLGSLIILNGTAVSSKIITSKEAMYDAEAILIISPSVLDALTFSVEIGDTVDNAAGTNFVTLQDETGADYVVPGAGKGIVYSLPLWPCFRLKASGNVAADRVFKLFKLSRGGMC